MRTSFWLVRAPTILTAVASSQASTVLAPL